MNTILKAIGAEYFKDYTLKLTFNNGEKRAVDFTPLMQNGICRKLLTSSLFVAIKRRTLKISQLIILNG